MSPASGATNFAFATPVAQGATYNVTISAQSAGATCVISNGGGTVGSGAVSGVQVNCTANRFSVGGTSSGLMGTGLVLANGADTLSPASGASNFTFGQQVASGATYAVSVQTQPANATCAVSNASGSIVAATVTNVQVSCTANTFQVGGTISGLAASGLILANGTNTVSPAANATSFVFSARIATGSSYRVSIAQQQTDSARFAPGQKLPDFGVANMLSEQTPGANSADALTPDTASPEQLEGLPLGTSSDVYSLGVILYELLSGHKPYALDRASSSLHAALLSTPVGKPSELVSDSVATARATTLPALRRRLRGELDAVVARCLAKSPADRYADVGAALLGAELDAAARRPVRVNLTDLRSAWRTTLGVAAPDTIVFMH